MRKTRLIAILLTLCMAAGLLLTGCGCGGGSAASSGTKAEQDRGASSGTEPEQQENAELKEGETLLRDDYAITLLLCGSNEVLVYYPLPNAADDSPIDYTCTRPTLMVFGDGAYDEASAAAFAEESGLAEIAAEGGGSILFVNPVGDSWGDADAECYVNVAQKMSESTSDTRAYGITTTVTESDSGEEVSQSITGTQQRMYLYGIGSGADYLASAACKTVIGTSIFSFGGYDIPLEADVTPAGLTLCGVSDVSGAETNDIPVVSVGNSDEVNSALAAVCSNLTLADEENYTEQFGIVGVYRRQDGLLLAYHDWESEGITEVVETATVHTSADNITFAGTETHELSYAVYYASDLDVTGDTKVSLVLCFHGGGDTAFYQAQAAEWPVIGKENGFLTVSVELHYPNATATEIVELIEHLKTEYSIDASRIYASGMSMGAARCWDLYEQYPEVFAGIAPLDGSFAPGTDCFSNAVEDVNSDTIVPVFYVGGEVSPLGELPNTSQDLIDRVTQVFQVNQVAKSYSVSLDDVDSWENPYWGVNGDESYEVADNISHTDRMLYVELFNSTDGNCYTALACAGGQSHELFAKNAWAAWDFLSQFSRAEDGSIQIS